MKEFEDNEAVEYQELETIDDIIAGYNAQENIYDKLYYYMLYNARAEIIAFSFNVLSDEERVEAGMPGDDVIKGQNPNLPGGYKFSKVQPNMVKNLKAEFTKDLNEYLFGVSEENFSYIVEEEDGSHRQKMPISLDALKKYHMFKGEVCAKFQFEVGKDYRKVKDVYSKTENDKDFLEFKTLYTLGKLNPEADYIYSITSMDFMNYENSMNLTLNSDSFLARQIKNFVEVDHTLDEFFEEFGIKENNAKKEFLDILEADGKVRVSEINKNYSVWVEALKAGWEREGINNFKKTLPMNKREYIEIGSEAFRINTENYKQYKSWFKNLPEDAKKIEKDNFLNSFKEESKIIKEGNPINAIDWKYAGKPNFSTYVDKHTGANMGANEEKMRENLSKAIAAYALEKSGKTFNVKDIHKIAEHFRDLYEIDSIKGEALRNCLKDYSTIRRTGSNLRKTIYGVAPKDFDSYVEDMQLLSENMQPEAGHSKEYINLVNAIREAANLNETTEGMSPAKKAEAFTNANINVFTAVQKYIKGKKSVRVKDSGKRCFNNALDAIAVVSKYNSSTVKVNKILKRINMVRNNGNPQAINYIDPNTFQEHYGAQAASAARMNGAVDRSNLNPINVVKAAEPIKAGKAPIMP
ncbi:MAG: hypothetical protein K6F77_00420 [Lachnospiraceae bacterium]|nr:hypothetical protein [Lachnospiraceae bacterium]